MPDFNQYLLRHGEFWVQEMIEQIEHMEGVYPSTDAPLETRWEALMQNASAQQSKIVA